MPEYGSHAAIHYRRIALHTLLSLATAFLLLAIFPKFDFRFLAPVALTPLLIALARTEDGWQRFIFGWAAGFFYWFFLCTWIQFVLEVHGGHGGIWIVGIVCSFQRFEGPAPGRIFLARRAADAPRLRRSGSGGALDRP